MDGVNDYTCQCPAEYSGRYCELEPLVSNLLMQTSPCQQHDCKHGICFMPTGAKDYVCKCEAGYSGLTQFTRNISER